MRRFKVSYLFLGLALVWFIASWSVLEGKYNQNLGFLEFNDSRKFIDGRTNDESIQHGIAYFERAIALGLDSSSAWRALGYLYAEGETEEKAFVAWQRSPGMVNELIKQGLIAEASNDFDEALAWYQRAAQVDPGSAEAWLFSGLIFEMREDWPSATTVYKSGVDLTADNSDLLFRLARIQSRQTPPIDWLNVLALLDKAIVRDSFLSDWNLGQAHLLRGSALDNLGYLQEARAEYIWLIENRSNQYWASVQLANLIWRVDQDAVAAEQYLRSAIDMDSDNKWAYRSLAELYVEMGRTDEAGELFRQILEMDPNDFLANQWLAQQ